ARMDAAEIVWRSRSADRIAADRVRVSLVTPAWSRRNLADRLTGDSSVKAAAALARGEWNKAQVELGRHLLEAPQRFVIGFRTRESLVNGILAEFPASAAESAARADRIIAGEYDLLGYCGLRFDRPADPASAPLPSVPDWHFDPVHGRRTS